MSAEIPLRSGRGALRGHAIVDACDEAWVLEKKWRINRGGYPYRSEGGVGEQRCVWLHRAVVEARIGAIPDGMVVHHINENPLDARFENLSVLTPSDHMRTHVFDITFRRRLNRVRGGAPLSLLEYTPPTEEAA